MEGGLGPEECSWNEFWGKQSREKNLKILILSTTESLNSEQHTHTHTQTENSLTPCPNMLFPKEQIYRFQKLQTKV